MVDLFSACALDCVAVCDCVLFCRLGVFVVCCGGDGGLVGVIGSCVVVRCSLFYVGLVLCCAWCLLCLDWLLQCAFGGVLGDVVSILVFVCGFGVSVSLVVGVWFVVLLW